jgi:putative glutamine amidotransferase
MSRPLIGVCAAVERAHFGPWHDEPATLLPLSYARSIQDAGGIAALLPPDPTSAESPAELLDHLDALVLGGGADVDPASHGSDPHPETKGTNPERDRFELALAREAMDRGMPLLGVCRGMQVLNIAAGGNIDQHLPEKLGHEQHRPVPGEWARHEVRLEPGSLACEAAGSERLLIWSHHHQGVGEVGEGFEASAWATVDDTIEAIEPRDDGGFTLGVLWHPEEDPEDRVIPELVRRASA